MKKERLITSILSIVMLSIIVLGTITFFVYEKKWIGFIFIILGLLHLLVLKVFGKKINSVWPDIIFGAIDNGFLVIAAIIGADFAGIFGAIIGGSAANAITDGFAGIFEGWTSEFLRKHKIKEERTALSSAIGKMAGCFFGGGIVLIIAWSIL
ncbi:MAG: hypothetical protein AABX61_02400 [Nanoarchaeota archaeon]